MDKTYIYIQYIRIRIFFIPVENAIHKHLTVSNNFSNTHWKKKRKGKGKGRGKKKTNNRIAKQQDKQAKKTNPKQYISIICNKFKFSNNKLSYISNNPIVYS